MAFNAISRSTVTKPVSVRTLRTFVTRNFTFVKLASTLLRLEETTVHKSSQIGRRFFEIDTRVCEICPAEAQGDRSIDHRFFLYDPLRSKPTLFVLDRGVYRLQLSRSHADRAYAQGGGAV